MNLDLLSKLLSCEMGQLRPQTQLHSIAVEILIRKSAIGYGSRVVCVVDKVVGGEVTGAHGDFVYILRYALSTHWFKICFRLLAKTSITLVQSW